MQKIIVMLGLLTLLGGCSLLPVPPPGDEKPVILESASGRTLDPEELLEKLLSARVIYLGEQHDNPHHHRLQRTILEKLIARGKRPALGFEFFSRDKTGWLMHFSVGKPSAFALKQAENPGEFLRGKLGWEGNADWNHYYPLLELARTHHLPIFGTDLPDGLRVRLTRGGLEGLSAIERAEWSPTGFVHADYQQWMAQKLAQSHCGMAPESLLQRLYATWVARNDAMARSIALMLAEQPDEPVVMVLGAGHVAHDMGVYERLAFLKPDIRQVNLGFRESHPDDPPLSQLREPVQVGNTRFAPEHQFFWLTPPAPTGEDPCTHLVHPTAPTGTPAAQ